MYLKNIDIEGLAQALESLSLGDSEEYYFDVKSGQIVIADNDEKIYQVEQYSQRFIVIKPLEKDEVAKYLKEFVLTLTNVSTEQGLTDALTARTKEYAKFKDIVSQSTHFESWQEFHKLQVSAMTKLWLDANQIAIETL